jgi:hypothetical protein
MDHGLAEGTATELPVQREWPKAQARVSIVGKLHLSQLDGPSGSHWQHPSLTLAGLELYEAFS